MKWKEFFKLDKGKVFLSFFIALTIVVVSFVAFNFFTLFKERLVALIVTLLFNIGLFTLLYYPFSSALVYCAKNYKKDKLKSLKKNKKDLVAILLIILLFNPITVGAVISFAISSYQKTFYETCGVEIVGFTEDSPAKAAGVSVGEVVLKIDDHSIVSINDLRNVLREKKPNQEVILETNTKIYRIKLSQNPQTGEAFLGVNLREKICKK
jgi:membrane-associated protease RseP (regulator of RpoE activity)